MVDDRAPLGVPLTPPTDELPETDEPVASAGFLVDDDAHPPTDGEQLFRQAIAPDAPPPPPISAAPGHLPAQTVQRSNPEENAVLFRILGGICVVIAPLIVASAQSLGSLVPATLLFLGGLFIFFYLGSVERLRRDQIVDRWDILIDSAQGHRDAVLAGTVARIEGQQLPQVRHETRDLATSLTRAETRPFLIVTNAGNSRLRSYRVHVNVRDYGTGLQANWYLSYHRGFFEKLKPNPLVALDLFDEQDLRAYVTAVHHSLLDAVVDLLIALGKDASKVERNSRGFLGIS